VFIFVCLVVLLCDSSYVLSLWCGVVCRATTALACASRARTRSACQCWSFAALCNAPMAFCLH